MTKHDCDKNKRTFPVKDQRHDTEQKGQESDHEEEEDVKIDQAVLAKYTRDDGNAKFVSL